MRKACGSAKTSGSARRALIGDRGVIVVVIMISSLDVVVVVIIVVAVAMVVAAAGSVGVVME